MAQAKLSPNLRALAIMEGVADADAAISSAELADRLQVPRASIHRIAQQLEQAGFLQREPGGKRFIAGPRTRRLALSVTRNSIVSAPRHTILKALSDEIGETCNCTLLDGGQIVYFDRVEANWPYRFELPSGSRHPLHCTASGKLLLAHLEPSRIKLMLSASPLTPHTDRTTTSPTALAEELEQVRAEGVGTDDEEYLPGMVAIAVPVYGPDGAICHAIAAHAPTVRKPLAELKRFLPALRKAADAMTATYREQA